MSEDFEKSVRIEPFSGKQVVLEIQKECSPSAVGLDDLQYGQLWTQ